MACKTDKFPEPPSHLILPDNLIFFPNDEPLQENWSLVNTGTGTIVPIQTSTRRGFLQNLLNKEKLQSRLFPNEVWALPETDIPGETDPSGDAYILFTSGTTSEPKGVRISYRALFSHLSTLAKVYKLGKDSKLFNNLMLSHADGIVQGPLLALYNSATLYRPFAFSIQRIEDAFDLIYRECITHWIMVPTMMGLIYQFKQQDTDTLNNGYFRYVISCGGKLEPKLWQQFEDLFKVQIINGYGLTETVTGGLFAGPDDDSHIIGSIGKPVDCEAKIMDDHNQEKSVGEQGEIWMRGSLLMSGYLNAPDTTAGAMAGEWFKTGDLGHLGEDGCFRITGRKKNIIISGGVNISPDEVTELLNAHPNVQEATTFGIEESLWGEIVACAIVVKNQQTLSKEEIIAWCRKNLEEKKVPAKVYFVGELPHGRSGKVMVESVKKLVAGLEETNGTDVDRTPVFLEIVSQCLNMTPDRVSLNMVAEETPAWDSISHLMLVAEMEKHFNIEFSPVEVMNIKRLGDLYSTVERKIKS
jgi:long-chain acyl-CoA synthetase